MWHSKAMDKGIVEAMATKSSENFAISMLKKYRKFCRRSVTHLNATLLKIVQRLMRHPECINMYILIR